jgi:hypothetical protein
MSLAAQQGDFEAELFRLSVTGLYATHLQCVLCFVVSLNIVLFHVDTVTF